MGEVYEKRKSKKKNRFKSFLKEFLPYVVIVGIALIIRIVFLVNAVTPTGSMLPTLPLDSRHMGLKCAYWFSEPERGDIIVFEAPDEPEKDFVKRVIGLPGETVEIKGGVTYINGEKLEEPYLKETPDNRDFGPFEVPDGHVFVMGDNRNSSNDARFWTNKYVSYDKILGKTYFLYWPKLEWLY